MRNVTKLLALLLALFLFAGIVVSCDQEKTIDSLFVKTAEESSTTGTDTTGTDTTGTDTTGTDTTGTDTTGTNTTDTSASDAGRVVIYYEGNSKSLSGSFLEYLVESRKVTDDEVSAIKELMSGKTITGMSFERILEITGSFSDAVFTGTLKDLQFDGVMELIDDYSFRTCVNLENVDFVGNTLPDVKPLAFPGKDEYTTNCGFGVPAECVEEAREKLEDFINDNGYLKIEVKILLDINESTYSGKFEDFGTPELSENEISTFVGKPVKVSSPTNEGYSFLGFYADKETTETQIFDAEGNAVASVESYTNEKGGWIKEKDTVLYAHWSKVPVASTAFTVNAGGKTVEFSKGNLYYNGSDWAFEENTYDYRTFSGERAVINGEYSATGTPNGNVGFFRWTSGTSVAVADVYNDPNRSVTDPFFADDESVMGAEWVALTKDEFNYLTNEREGAADKRGYARIEIEDSKYVNGLILLPDSFKVTAGCTFTSGTDGIRFSDNTYTASQWATMEASGAVFLPAIGRRDENSFQDAMGYWTASLVDSGFNSAEDYAFYYYICENWDPEIQILPKYFGYFVRLVKEKDPGAEVKISYNNNGGSGTMTEQSTYYGKKTKLNTNTFTKDGYEFAGWTTESNSSDVIYQDGAIVSFKADTTLYAVWKEDVKGFFSVSSDKTVSFAPGNLYYEDDGDVERWGFEDNQYDFRTRPGQKSCIDGVPEVNGTPEGYKGLFYWSASQDVALGDSYDINASNSSDDELFAKTLVIDNETWNTLSYEEWNYLLTLRANAADKVGLATVAQINGVVILPDDWNLPENCSFTSGTDSAGFNYLSNIYTKEQWALMEGAGAVFLPATGEIDLNGNPHSYCDIECCFYLTSSPSLDVNSYEAAMVFIHDDSVTFVLEIARSRGCAIRLVKTYEEWT